MTSDIESIVTYRDEYARAADLRAPDLQIFVAIFWVEAAAVLPLWRLFAFHDPLPRRVSLLLQAFLVVAFWIEAAVRAAIGLFVRAAIGLSAAFLRRKDHA